MMVTNSNQISTTRIEARCSRQILSRRYRAIYHAELPIAAEQLPVLAEQLIRIEGLLGNDASLVDLKGRDASQVLLEVSGDQQPAQDELLFLAGTILGDPHRAFSLRVITPFERFEGSAHIVHRQKAQHLGDLPRWLTGAQLTRAIPLQLTHLRIGMLRYRSTLRFTNLGYAPTVVEMLLVDANRERCALRFESSHLRTCDELPLSDGQLLQRFDRAVQSGLGFSVIESYRERVRGS